jgi:6-pyruvoyltetrahydropterin/6-carboxytetrahydropterin synthase
MSAIEKYSETAPIPTGTATTIWSKSRVLDDVDHRNLNLEVPWLEGMMPSTENVAVAIWDRISPALPDGVRLCRVFLRETSNNSVEYTGPQEV